ncbi:unnamed protein product, partial [Prorocentrum cordatum]
AGGASEPSETARPLSFPPPGWPPILLRPRKGTGNAMSSAASAASPMRWRSLGWHDVGGGSCRARPAAAADAACVRQALESLRLDVEAVFDRHGELWREPPPTAGESRGSGPDSPEEVPGQPSSPVRSVLLGRRASPKRAFAEQCSLASSRSNEAMAAMQKVKNVRGTFLREENTTWMHTLLPTGRHSWSKVWLAECLPSGKLRACSSAKKLTEGVSKLVRRPGYELARVMMMVLDAVLVVWEMQCAAQRAIQFVQHGQAGIDDTAVFTVLLDISCGLFVTDFLLRCTAGQFGPTVSAGRGWQYFHVVVVIAQLVQTIGLHSHRHQRSHSQFRVALAMFSTLRVARVLSLVQVTEVIRQHPFFRELRIMIHSLTGAVKGLLWSSLLIFTILLIFGTVLSEGALAYLVHNGREGAFTSSSVALQARFGSLFHAVLTLFQAMSGGVDWHDVWQILDVLDWGYRGVFLLYIGFSLFSLLNVVTAVFILEHDGALHK